MNQQLDNPFEMARSNTMNAIANVAEQREVASIQAAMVIAKKFPRDPVASMDRILNACTRKGLAEGAVYEYAKGGSNVSGPSIRMAEMLAQQWGNLEFGIRELEQRHGESTVEAFAWDIETNTRQVKVFQVPHLRHTKKGSYKLEDPREIYELVANQGARRLRACILGVIPADVIEAATKQCETTLQATAEVTPDRIASVIEKFAAFGVTKEMIEKRIQRRIDTMTPALMVNLGKIYNSIKDGMSSAGDWFEIVEVSQAVTPKTAAEKLKEAAQSVASDEPKISDEAKEFFNE
jgi:hypothetical protein